MTGVFTELNMPQELTRSNSTRAGTWGQIEVLEGSLRYRIIDSLRPRSEVVVTPDTSSALIEPLIQHQLWPGERVRFRIRYFRRFV